MLNLVIDLMERGLIPDALIRQGIRKLCSQRLQSLNKESLDEIHRDFQSYVMNLKSSPVAIATVDANRQHYEVPADFFELCLGKNKKYSCSFWSKDCTELDQAEEASLAQTMMRAELKDGMNILELGCGWGSLSLAMAKNFPQSKITAISNSSSQKRYIDEQAKMRGLDNLTVITQDVSQLESLAAAPFDRVVSVEMLEHFRNYEVLLERISSWLKKDGKLFVHIFTHQRFPYFFETEGDDNWMGKYFFTGGQMPSHHLLAQFQKDLLLENQWCWNGDHYQKTSEAWLKNIDQNQTEILRIFQKVYGVKDAKLWFQRWRVFFIAVAELFGYSRGLEWGVSHYLFKKRSP